MLHKIGSQTNEEAIEETKNQIDEAEERIEAFKAECIKTESFYLTQIDKSKAHLKEEKNLRQNNLQELKKLHESEVAEMEEKEKKEIENIKNRIAEHSNGNKGFRNHKNGLHRAIKEAELSDLKHQLEIAKLKKAENALDKSTRIKNVNSQNDSIIQELNMKIETLIADIGSVKSNSQTSKLQASGKKRETELKYEMRCKENDKKYEEMKMRLHEKQEENNKIIQKAEENGSLKIEQYRKELDNAQVQMQEMANLQEKLRKKYNNQISSLQEEIENARDAVEMHTEKLKKQQEDVVEREHKLNEMMKENIILNETIKSLNMDITKTKHENKSLKRESTRMESQMYTDRVGTVRKTTFF